MATKKPARTYADHCRIALRLRLARETLLAAMDGLGPGTLRIHDRLALALAHVDRVRADMDGVMHKDFAGNPPEPRLYYLPTPEIERRLREAAGGEAQHHEGPDAT